MADKPILFSGPMVRALLAGTKTQTRRAMPDQPPSPEGAYHRPDGRWIWTICGGVGIGEPFHTRYRFGDRLYVREHWRTEARHDGIAPRDLGQEAIVSYEANYDREPNDGCRGRFRQGMHMPRWASRLTLTVTDVRVQRLQDISEDDARAEGIERAPYGNWKCYGATPKPFRGAAPTVLAHGLGVVSADPVHSYASLWDSINGEGAWDANPWVAAYTFTVQRGNIDQIGSMK